MFVFTVNIYHENGQLKSAAELLEAIKETAGTGPAMVAFSPEENLEKDTAQAVLMQLPQACAGIALNTLAHLDNTQASIEQLETWCSWLPPHVKVLDLSKMIHFSVEFSLQYRFFKALPKTLDQVILCFNHIGYCRTPDEVRTLFAELEGVRTLDVRNNNFHEINWDYQQNITPILPRTCTTVYTDLTDEQSEYNQYWLQSLPPNTHTLNVEQHEALFSSSAWIPSTVTTLKLSSLGTGPMTLPPQITTLDFSGEVLSADVTFNTLPPQVNTLILENLAYCYRTATQWITSSGASPKPLLTLT